MRNNMYSKKLNLLFIIFLIFSIKTTSAQYGYSHYDDIPSPSTDIITIGEKIFKYFKSFIYKKYLYIKYTPWVCLSDACLYVCGIYFEIFVYPCFFYFYINIWICCYFVLCKFFWIRWKIYLVIFEHKNVMFLCLFV